MHAVQTVRELLIALSEHPEALQDNYHRIQLRRLIDDLAADHIDPRWIKTVEEAVLHGRHGGTEDDDLDYFLLRYRTPFSKQERLRYAHVSLLAAHRAMNLGRFDGQEGLVRLAERAARLYEGLGAPDKTYRLSHLHRIRAIGLRHLGHLSNASDALARARAESGQDPKLLHDIRNQGVLLDVRKGLVQDASRGAQQLLDEAERLNDSDLYSRRLLTVGAVETFRGKLDRSEEFIERSIEGRKADHIAVHAFTLLAQTVLYQRRGDLDRTYDYAKKLVTLVKPFGMEWHLSRAEAAIAWYLRGDLRGPVKWGDDVF